MKTKDELLLEKAYLSVSKAVPGVPSDEEDVMDSEDIAGDIDDGSEDHMGDMAGMPSKESPLLDPFSSSSSDCCDEESEEDEMVITNLDSIRESITKIASFCSCGGHLESWQQQKLAVAMDNLAEVARRIRR